MRNDFIPRVQVVCLNCGTSFGKQRCEVARSPNHLCSIRCRQKWIIKTYHTPHGYAKRGERTITYTTWVNIRRRCQDPKNSHYKYYGGRGIRVCERWESFENFVADMGEKPLGMTIERIDNDLGYSPDNCRWAPPQEQYLNRSDNHFLEFGGRRMTVKQWACTLGIPEGRLYARVKYGWSAERALTEAVRPGSRWRPI